MPCIGLFILRTMVGYARQETFLFFDNILRRRPGLSMKELGGGHVGEYRGSWRQRIEYAVAEVGE